MKKTFLPVLLVLLGLGVLLIGCSKTVPANTIGPKNLTDAQKEIIDLITIENRQYPIFEYNIDSDLTHADFWIEIYEKGELKESLGGLTFYSDEGSLGSGTLAISIEQEPYYRWTLTQSENGTKSSVTAEAPDADYASATARAYGGIDEPVIIEKGEEIVLYSMLFSNDGILVYSDEQIYSEQPELLKNYEYVHLIKCRFE